MTDRGFASVVRTVKKFVELHGYETHWGAWLDIKLRGHLVLDFQVGTWWWHRPPKRGAKCALYVTTEGPIPRHAREWLKGYDYLFAQSRFVKMQLEAIDLDCILMPVGIDTDLFRPIDFPKLIDVLSIGICDSEFDKRKFMNLVPQVCEGVNFYAHQRPTLRYEELPLLYNLAKVYLSTSAVEGFNIPVLEANACGIPAVYNNAPATNEHAFGTPVKPKRVYTVTINTHSGPYHMVFHEPDVEGLRIAVRSMLEAVQRNPELRRRAREHALQYDYRKTYTPLLEVLPRP